MSGFDPYHRWLGIPPQEQPPHHYRLLGIALFEGNPDVIESAADRQMAHVRTFQTGTHGKDSQRILNEIAAAKLVLLTAAKKSAYDQQLRAQLAPPQPTQQVQPALAVARNMPPQPAPVMPVVGEQSSTTGAALASRNKRSKSIGMVPLGFAGGVIVFLIITAISLAMRKPQTPENDQPDPALVVVKSAPPSKVPPVRNREQVQPPAVVAAIPQTNPQTPPTPATEPVEVVQIPSPAANKPPPVNKTDATVVPVSSEGLLGHWPMDEGQGETAYDVAGGHHGTIKGAAWTTRHGGPALHFDGTAALVELGGPPEFNIVGPITMAAWIRPEHRSPGITFMNVIGNRDPSDKRGIYLRVSNSQYAVGCYTGVHEPTERRIPDEDIRHWVHLAGVYDGQSWHIYRNGEPFCNRKTKYGPVAFDGSWAIGAYPIGQGRYFQGDIDDVWLYRRALSAEEIRSLWQTTGGATP